MGFGPQADLLRELAFQVGAGETVGIQGANGVGKSTLLRLAAGLLRPRRGQIRVLDAEAPVARRRGWIGWCHPDTGFLRRVSLRTNLATLTRFDRSPSASLADRLETLAEGLGLTPYLEVPCERCSSGTLQRARLVQVLLRSPRVALLDEPLRGIDAASRPGVARFVRRQLGAAACLWVSHSQDELDGVADKALTLHDGRLHAGARHAAAA
ncbi:MAG: ATP-binding cassette domain-containing protein [Myxococcota bacterium]